MGLADIVILVKGGGEVGSAVAHRLARCHFKVCIAETPHPLAVCRTVAFCEAVYDGEKEVEGVTAKLVGSAEEVLQCWKENKVPVIVDPEASIKDVLHPDVVIDAIMAKRNLVTRIGDAPLVIGLGPGFEAPKDVHVVVETNHSHNLGRVILHGQAEANTGIPLAIGGYTTERAIHAPEEGRFICDRNIGDRVSAGEVVAFLEGRPLRAEIGGLLRGLLRSGLMVKRETKLVEIDPVGPEEACYIIRDKMRTISGGVLEAILMQLNARVKG